MTQKNISLTSSTRNPSLTKSVMLGAGIALILISIFLAGVDEADPTWGKFWIVRPLIIVSMAGALGGAFYYFMTYLRREEGWNKVLTLILSLIGYLVALWLGSVLGLDGTLWN